MILLPKVVLLCWLKLGERGGERCFVHQQVPLGDIKAFSFCWANLDVSVLLQCCLTFLCSKGQVIQPGRVSYSAAARQLHVV